MSDALVIGAGPAGLMAADVLSAAGHRVTVADRMPSVGRKFLMAGKSGLNLTKDEPLDAFVAAFGPVPPPFQDAIRDFGPAAVQAWARDLGQTVFTGSTGRVFPTAMKASPLLRAWLVRLRAQGCTFQTRWTWAGWDGDGVVFATPDGHVGYRPDVTVLAMGGGSWARLGSDGAWAAQLLDTAPFKPANCGFRIPWTEHMARFHGEPVKATALRAGALLSRGEWVISPDGIEGGGVYEVSAAVRDGAALHVDLVPDLTPDDVADRLAAGGRKASRTERLRKGLRLSPVKIALLNEFGRGQAMPLDQLVKALPLGSPAPLAMDDAISTAGGLRFSALDAGFMLKDRPGIFAAGEMLDWEAPTGGYLITGCLSTGRAAGLGAAAWLANQGGKPGPGAGFESVKRV